MDLLNILGLERRIAQAEKESPDERYARVELDLGATENVGKNIKIPISGDYLAKIKYSGSATGCYFKFGTKRSSIIYASEFRKRHTPFIEFPCIFLTNEVAQPGKVLTFFVGGAFAGEIEPSTGEKMGLTDSDGADIDPATEGTSEESRVLLETLEANAFDSDTDSIKQGFGGNAFNLNITAAMVTDDAKHAFAASSKKLRDIIIKNTHATQSIMIGENQADVATMRAEDFELEAGESMGFVMIDLSTLYYCTKVNTEEPTVSVIGTEE